MKRIIVCPRGVRVAFLLGTGVPVALVGAMAAHVVHPAASTELTAAVVSRARPLATPVAMAGAVRAVKAEVERGAFPGAALAAGRGGQVQLIEGVGATTWKGSAVEAERTVYDLASLTKVVATTTAAMLLYEDGRLSLDAPVSSYLPEFTGGGRDRVTVRALLSHTSGLPAGAVPVGENRAERVESLVRTPLRQPPGSGVTYSDVGFVVLGEVLERAAGEPLPGLLERRVYEPLGMSSTGFNPGDGCDRCAPTMITDAGVPLAGVVHDPIARALGGVAGNAGLFSTAADLSRYAAMLASGGELEGVRVLRGETIETFARRQPDAPGRALGWEVPRGTTGPVGETMSPSAFGHTGFTGTSLWVDPERGTWAVLLANRTYDARASNRIQKLRRTVHAYVTESADAFDSAAALVE